MFLTFRVYPRHWTLTCCHIVTDFYQPAGTSLHTSVLVENQLYVWAGFREDIPVVHSSIEKLRAISYVDVFECRLGMWVRMYFVWECVKVIHDAIVSVCKRTNVVIRDKCLWHMKTVKFYNFSIEATLSVTTKGTYTNLLWCRCKANKNSSYEYRLSRNL